MKRAYSISIENAASKKSDREDKPLGEALVVGAPDGDAPARLPLVCGRATLTAWKSKLIALISRPVFNPDVFPSDEGRRAEHVHSLAKAGWDCLGELLGGDGRAAFVGLMDFDGIGHVEVRQGREWLPWNLLYLQDPDVRLELDSFLGARHLLVEVLQTDCFVHDSAEDLGFHFAYGAGAHPGYGLVDDDELLGKGHAERAVLDRVGQALFRPLVVPGDAGRPPLDTTLFDAELARYAAYVAGNWRALHFAAHAVMPCHDPTRYRMRVSSAFEHEIDRLEDELDEQGASFAIPFIFFNACYSAVGAGAPEYGAAMRFHQRGVRAALGTSGVVDDALAGAFAKAFYETAIENRRPVGPAFREARADFLGSSGNPVVFSYCFHGQPDVVLNG